jgi:HEAT repeat protein
MEGYAMPLLDLFRRQNVKPSSEKRDRVSELIADLAQAQEVSVRENAARLLGESRDVRAIAPLISVLDGDHWRVRGAATEALQKIGPSSIEPLVRALKHKDWGVRESIVRTLGEIGDSRAVEHLIAALNDESPEVRDSTAVALAKIGNSRAIEPLVVLARESEMSPKLAEAIGKLCIDEAVEPLIKAMNNPNHYLRRRFAESLAMIGEPALGPLINVLNNKEEDWRIREGAAWALGDMKNARAIAPLIIAQGDDNQSVQEAATWALSVISDSSDKI